MAKTLLVRVQPRSGLETFFRCGIKFSQEWQPVDVDDATAARLQAEQMLEVVDKVEEVFEPAPADADAPVAAPATLDSSSSMKDDGAPAAGLQEPKKETSAPQATTPADAAAPVAVPATPRKAGK